MSDAGTRQDGPLQGSVRETGRRGHPVTDEFAAARPFALDDFQYAACEALEDGSGVLVAAPTGAGKTVVGVFAVHRALRCGAKAFYTTPIKALSNQKYRELRAQFGADRVGLLTGDVSVNGDADVLVMTTEVLRNMLYARSPALRGLQAVVMDEVHYLADRFRGAVWEEVIIHLPAHVQVACLSATVSNAEEFGDWLDTVRGSTEVIVSEVRPVPLEQHVFARGDLIPLFHAGAAGRVNRDLEHLVAPSGRSRGPRGRRGGPRRGHRRPETGGRVRRADVVTVLERENLLPAIFFIFSRAGCEAAVSQVARSGVRLTTAKERARIEQIVQERLRDLPEQDRAVLGFDLWLRDLGRGIAAHHAGLLPAFKEVVEELFQQRLVKVVFATETLALGINMPARSVVLERLEKFNGVARAPVTPGEYTQLTGRAGRRGIDVEGHAVIVWDGRLDPHAVAALASKRTYPLNSSFAPTYNMAVNLIDRFGRERTREILQSSFAQFQADRAVVDLARTVREHEASLAGYREAMTCSRGDFFTYAQLRRQLSDLEKRGRTGVDPQDYERTRARIREVREELSRHPCHSCPDRETHARWGNRYMKLERATQKLRRTIRGRTGSVARRFDRVVDVLAACDYLREDGQGSIELTASGRRMQGIYGERDLLVAEALRMRLWEGLDAPALAAMVCTLVFEPRRGDDESGVQALPRGAFRTALGESERLWARLDDLEHQHDLPGTTPPAAHLAQAMFDWARGAGLDAVLAEADMAAGDFVRWAKQSVDLLDQIRVVADDPVARVAGQAAAAIRRDIVAYSSV